MKRQKAGTAPRPTLIEMQLLLSRLDQWRGAWVEIVEQLGPNLGSSDRHSTSTGVFRFQLEHAGIRFSGGRLTLAGCAGNHDASYEIAVVDHCTELRLSEAEIVLVEHLGPNVERRTQLRRLPAETP